MSNDKIGAFWAGICVAAILSSILFGIVQTGIDNSWRQQIADHGCAEYYLDQNHDRQWRWK